MSFVPIIYADWEIVGTMTDTTDSLLIVEKLYRVWSNVLRTHLKIPRLPLHHPLQAFHFARVTLPSYGSEAGAKIVGL